MPVLEHLEAELKRLDEQGLRRDSRRLVAREGLIDACSNDYLGYAHTPVSRETLDRLRELPSGAGASRLVHGTHAIHCRLEDDLADWVGLPAALLFSSGYAANLGALTALVAPTDLVVSDELNHASLIDGCRLSGAQKEIVPHLDVAAVDSVLERARALRTWVATESYFSMEGDSPDLAALRAVCDRHRAGLIVDEAHALGVFGPTGAGKCAAHNVTPDCLIGTLGKAIACQGAFVAGSEVLRHWLWNRARSFVFSTAPSPLIAAVTRDLVARARADDPGRSRLRRAAADVRARLTAGRVRVAPGSHGPIVPVLFDDSSAALAAAEALLHQGVLARAIRPPTVPAGAPRLRLTLHAGMTDGDIDRLTRAVLTTCAA